MSERLSAGQKKLKQVVVGEGAEIQSRLFFRELAPFLPATLQISTIPVRCIWQSHDEKNSLQKLREG